MKKAAKNLLAALLALAMLCTMALPVWAAPSNSGTIIIHDAAVGETYHYYRIFKLNSFDNSGHYSYTVEQDWKPFFAASADGAEYIELDNHDHPTWKTDKNTPADHAEFAKKALAWATAQSITATRTTTATSDTVLVDNLDLGYYLVDTSLGSLCHLTTTDISVTITEKNPKPTLSFSIIDGATHKTEIHSATNDIILYCAAITVNKGTDKLKFEVQFPAGMIYQKAVSTPDAILDVDYTASFDAVTSKLTVTFTKSFLDSLSKEKKVEFFFRAKVNVFDNTPKSCIIDGAGNVVTGQLFYGDASFSTPQNLTTYVHQFDLIKYDAVTKKLLAGAEFEVYDTQTGGNPIVFGEIGLDEWYVAAPDEEHPYTRIGSQPMTVKFLGLGGKTYYLEEVKAPAGYNKAEGRIAVNLTTSSILTQMPTGASTYEDTYGGVAVKNQSGIELPSTGGMGTTIFYVVGGLLMVGAAVLLVTKKRMQKN